jgi:hypothetical protein
MKELNQEIVRLIDAIVDNCNSDADELYEKLKPVSESSRRAYFHYWDCRLAGSSPKLAEMLAIGQAPCANTDREFCEGRVDNSHIFGGGPLAEDTGNRLKKVAEAGGQNVKGKMYIGGLARYPGDPEAWVSDRGDVKRVIEKRGWRCQGSVEVNPDGLSDELAARFRERKVAPGHGLDMDEEGHIESLAGSEEAKAAIIERIDRGDAQLVEQR